MWGRTPHDAAHNAVVLEAVARMAYRTLSLNTNAMDVSQALLDRHYFRKHGTNGNVWAGEPQRAQRQRTELSHTSCSAVFLEMQRRRAHLAAIPLPSRTV